MLKKGDHVRLDGDQGTVTRIDREARFDRAIEAIDAVNAEDPNRLRFSGESGPKELLHAQRATFWVRELETNPSEALLLAARAHHLRRWHLPRTEYPAGRSGYYAWRRELQNRHAREASAILENIGYSDSERARVGELIRKRGLGTDPEVQTLEDALCLVFIESQLASFSKGHAEDKVINIIARSLSKMSRAGREASSRIQLEEHESKLVSAALERFRGTLLSQSS